jgi:hypothetical protein
MSKTAWFALGLVGMGCGSSKLVADNFDGGRDAPGTGLDTGSSCPASSLSSSRHTFAWTFAAAAADSGVDPDGGGAADAGPDAAAPSRCIASTSGFVTETCIGGAWLRSSAVGPILMFDDGSTLTWDPVGPPTPAPYVHQAGGDRVWARYGSSHSPPCGDCATEPDLALEIREGTSGTVRFYAAQGIDLSDLSDGDASDIFGVTATASPTCASQVTNVCASVDRTEFSHILQTSPAQTVPFAAPTQVTTPNGTYAVLWTASSDANPMFVACEDFTGLVRDNGFVATRLGP